MKKWNFLFIVALLGFVPSLWANLPGVLESPELKIQDVVDSRLEESEKSLVIQNIERDPVMTCAGDNDESSDPDSWGQVLLPQNGPLVAVFKFREQFVVGVSSINADDLVEASQRGQKIKFYSVKKNRSEKISFEFYNIVPSLGTKAVVKSYESPQRGSFFCRHLF